jgi:hypothetical protein
MLIQILISLQLAYGHGGRRLVRLCFLQINRMVSLHNGYYQSLTCLLQSFQCHYIFDLIVCHIKDGSRSF